MEPVIEPGAELGSEVGRIRTIDELKAVAGPWSALARRDPSAHVFQSHTWLTAWLSHQADAEPDILYTRRGNRLTAALPLCRHTFGRPVLSVQVLRFIADNDSDYCDALCDPAFPHDPALLWTALLERRDWHLLDLRYVPAGAHLTRLIGCQGKGLVVDQRHQDVAPYLDLARDWRQTLPKQQRGSILRRMRRLNEQGEVGFDVAGSPEEVGEMLGQLAATHIARWDARGQTSMFRFRRYCEWLHALCLQLHAEGRLYLCRLTLRGDPVSIGLYFLDNRRLLGYVSAFATAYMEYGPGHLLEAHVVDDVRARGLADVDDFGRGREEYKLRWSQQVRTLDRYLIARHSPTGRAALWWAASVKPFIWKHHQLGTVAREIRRRVALRRK